MPIKRTQSKSSSCKHGRAKEFSIERKYLTVAIELCNDDNYISTFMMALMSQVCCDGVQIPFLICLINGEEGTQISDKQKGYLTLEDIRSLLISFKKMNEERIAEGGVWETTKKDKEKSKVVEEDSESRDEAPRETNKQKRKIKINRVKV